MKKILFLLSFLPYLTQAQIRPINDFSSMQKPGSAPALSFSPNSFTGMTSIAGSRGTSVSGTLTGSNLGSNNTTTATLTGFVQSLDNSTFTTTVTVPTTGGSVNLPVYIALAPGNTAQPYSGNIVFTNTAFGTLNVSVSGTTSPATPTINITGTFTPFSTTQGSASATQTLGASASNLTAGVKVVPDSPLQVSTDNITFVDSTVLSQSSGALVGQPVTTYYRIPATAPAQSGTGKVRFSSTGATNQDVTTNYTIASAAVVARFNFSLASHTCSNWNNLAGSPATAIRSATDGATGITCSTVATANWSGGGAADGGGTQASNFFADCSGTANAVMANCFFPNLPNPGTASGDTTKITFQISGVTNAHTYTLKIGGATVNGSVGSRVTGIRVKGALPFSAGTAVNYNPGDATNGANTTTTAGVTITGIRPDSGGNIYIVAFRTATAQGIVGALTITQE